MKSKPPLSGSVIPERCLMYTDNYSAPPGLCSSSLASGLLPSCQREDLGLHSWHWPTLEPGPSNQSFQDFRNPSGVPKQARFRSRSRPSHITSQSMMGDLPPLGCDPNYLELQRSSMLSSDVFPPIYSANSWEPSHRCAPPKESAVFGDSHCDGPEAGHLQTVEDESLSPLDCQRKRLLASPFSEDSDSDDGLAPSPFSSPESSNALDEVDEERSPPYFSSPSDVPGYQHLDEYPPLQLYHDSPDEDELPPLPISFSSLSFSSPTTLESKSGVKSGSSSGSSALWVAPPLSPLDHPSSIEQGLQSPSLRSSSLPLFEENPYFYYDMSSSIPDSPLHHSSDLPSLDEEPHLHSESLGLSSGSSTSDFSPISPVMFDPGDHDFSAPSGFPQRTTWLSLPGAETDDDLIPADLASKNYIPDPSLAIPTTPPSRSLLIWDPTTRSGLPPGIPTFDGTRRPLSHRYFVNEIPSSRAPSPDENFEVDPNVVAELAKKDAEKGQEAQKLCELRQRTTMAAVIAAATAASKSGNKDRDGAQWEAEKVKERWREVTALLRLKLKSEEKKNDTSGFPSLSVSDPSVENGAQPSSSADPNQMRPLTSCDRSSSLPTSALPSTAESPGTSLTSSTSDAGPTSSPQTQIHRRSSKHKITSMAQLVANMVFHRQQEALRRSPSRTRTWPVPSSVPQTSGLGSKKLLSHATPKSPLRQMILPGDIENESEVAEDENASESPLQLSPLCLTMCQSPDTLYGCLEAQPTTSLAGLEG